MKTRSPYTGHSKGGYAVKVVKVIIVFFMLVTVLCGLAINKGLVLFVTSQVKQANNVTCHTYNPNTDGTPVKNSSEIHFCLATPDDMIIDWDRSTCIQHEEWHNNRTDHNIQVCKSSFVHDLIPIVLMSYYSA